MGGKGIFKFLRTHCRGAITTASLEDQRGKTFVFDISQSLHTFGRSISKKSGGLFTTKSGKKKIHIYTLMTIARICLEGGIIPVYVFDGGTVRLKQNVVKKRIKDTSNAKLELEQLLIKSQTSILSDEENDRMGKLRSKSFRVDKYVVADCCRFLRLIGLPHIVAPEEADPQCTMLEQYEKLGISGVVGEDSDLLAFGAKILLKNFKKNQKIEVIDRVLMLKCLDISFTDFVDVFIFSGVDYCASLRGVTIDSVYKFYKNIKQIDNTDLSYQTLSTLPGFNTLSKEEQKECMSGEYRMICQFLLKYMKDRSESNIPTGYLKTFIDTKDRYMKTCQGYDPAEFSTKWGSPDFKKLYAFLNEDFEFSTQEVEMFLNTVSRCYREYSVPRIISPKFLGKCSFNSYTRNIDKMIKKNVIVRSG